MESSSSGGGGGIYVTFGPWNRNEKYNLHTRSTNKRKGQKPIKNTVEITTKIITQMF